MGKEEILVWALGTQAFHCKRNPESLQPDGAARVKLKSNEGPTSG